MYKGKSERAGFFFLPAARKDIRKRKANGRDTGILEKYTMQSLNWKQTTRLE